MRLSLDPTLPKVVVIAVLIVLEGLLGSAYTIVHSGRMPTQVEWMGFIIVAGIQLLTFLITFLETGQAPQPSSNTLPQANTAFYSSDGITRGPLQRKTLLYPCFSPQ